MSYLVFYTEYASPMVKQFKSFTAARKFADSHELKRTEPYSDEWVDCIIEGKIVKTYNCWYGKPVKEKK
jgi:hypothetical protein